MVGIHAGGDVGVQVIAGKARGVTTLLRKATALCIWPVGIAASIAPTGR